MRGWLKIKEGNKKVLIYRYELDDSAVRAGLNARFQGALCELGQVIAVSSFNFLVYKMVASLGAVELNN